MKKKIRIHIGPGLIIFLLVWAAIFIPAGIWVYHNQNQLIFKIEDIVITGNTTLYRTYSDCQSMMFGLEPNLECNISYVEPPLAYKIYVWQKKLSWLQWLAFAYFIFFAIYYKDEILRFGSKLSKFMEESNEEKKDLKK